MSADARRFIIAHAEARRRAIACVSEAPDGWTVRVEPPRRDLNANAALHAALGEIARVMPWAGKMRSIDRWKRLFVASWGRANGEQIELLPALDGNGVDIVYRHTSDMTQDEIVDLMSWMDAWSAEQPELNAVDRVHRVTTNSTASNASAEFITY